MSKEIIVFTDGSSEIKSKKGGSGVYITSPIKRGIRRGYYPTKIGRCELHAVILAIQQVKVNFKGILQIYSDSQYVVNSINKKWVYKWKQEGWIGRKNIDLWKEFLEELEKRKFMKLKITHVKGHQKNLNDPLAYGNHIADRLANYATQKKFIEEHPEEWEI